MGKIGNGLSIDVAEPTSDFVNDPGRDSIRFFNLPMPPSSNHQYSLFRRGSKTLHIPSKALKEYKQAMSSYPLLHSNSCLIARALMRRWLDNRLPLEFHSVFYFSHQKLFTKDNQVKRLDVSNRIKALHDCMGEMLQVDDSMIFRLTAEKAISQQNAEMVCVEIQPFQ